METESVFKLVLIERARQNEKWGWPRTHFDSKWFTIFIEEVGEIAKALLEGSEEDVKTESIHAIAVLFAWMESKFEGEINGTDT